MSNLNIDSIKDRTFDAIVIGSGISGGWAAKELTEKGLKTLVLERGRDVEHLKDYPTTNMMPWEFKHRGQLPLEIVKENPVIGNCYAVTEDTIHFFTKDKKPPYIQEKPFDWFRGYQVGGKSLTWGRQTQRWSDFEFEGPARDNFVVDWPIRYKDVAPWYSYVEKFVGISGNKDGLPGLPDGEFLPPFQLSCVEKHFKEQLTKQYKDRHLIAGRCANITEPQPIHLEQGRGKCQNRTLCRRGCPFGGYFSSNSSTLPWAKRTGNLTLRPFSVVDSLIYDDLKEKVIGVKVIDSFTKETIEFYAKIFFVNASALNTTQVLLNSKSKRFPNGLGNDNELLGKYVAFHNYRGKASAEFEGFEGSITDGRRPTGGYIPRFRNLYKQETDFLRGYAAGIFASRSTEKSTEGIGMDLKKNLFTPPKPGVWKIGAHMMGETIPKESNYVALDDTQKDEWGIPLLKISVDFDDNDEKMIQDFFEQFTEMYEKSGFTNIKTNDSHHTPGFDIHEMGGARMGRDPKTSLLNEWNQLHLCKNVFVTDGACMTSTGTQNPSLTYMALTARAVDYAVKEMKKMNL